MQHGFESLVKNDAAFDNLPDAWKYQLGAVADTAPHGRAFEPYGLFRVAMGRKAFTVQLFVVGGMLPEVRRWVACWRCLAPVFCGFYLPFVAGRNDARSISAADNPTTP